MALTRCARCSEELSDQVTTCPNCGYSLRELPADASPTRPAPESSVTPATPEVPNKAPRDSPTAGIEETFRKVYSEQGPIQAIKYWRQVTGASLAQAKAFYDQEKTAGRLGETARQAKPLGCSWLLLLILLVLVLVAAYVLISLALIQKGSYH